jgi:hypothetical protein
MQEDFKAMSMHSATLMTRRDMRQPVGRLQQISAPQMGILGRIEIHALVCGALHANGIDAGDIEAPAQPSCKVLIRRLINQIIQRLIIERGNGTCQTCSQPVDFIARKCSPLVW